MSYTETNEMTNLVKLEIEGIGDIIVELDEKAAPLTAANFKTLVSKGFYNGLIFHRVIEGFMIQGGNPTGTGYGGSEVTIKGEFRQNGINNPLSHTRGTISMARSANPDSASSQFFICHADSPFLDGQYAAFGKVIEGMDVVDQIACCETDHRDRPLKEQKIKRAVFVKA
jgi:peptidyl-prolyl cis-trans isomerase B (cyclophilin B)